MSDDDARMRQEGITDYEFPSRDNIAKGMQNHLIGDGNAPKPGDFFFFYCKLRSDYIIKCKRTHYWISCWSWYDRSWPEKKIDTGASFQKKAKGSLHDE